jgi:hypothetical protein
MAKAPSRTEIRASVRELAKGFCEYCRIEEATTGHEFTLDHVSPESLGGPTTPENLAHACIGCNVRKSNKTHAPDPVDGTQAPLYNPRQIAGGIIFAGAATAGSSSALHRPAVHQSSRSPLIARCS